MVWYVYAVFVTILYIGLCAWTKSIVKRVDSAYYRQISTSFRSRLVFFLGWWIWLGRRLLRSFWSACVFAVMFGFSALLVMALSWFSWRHYKKTGERIDLFKPGGWDIEE